jgi:hypothetical protein
MQSGTGVVPLGDPSSLYASQFLVINNTNMAVMRICEVEATLMPSEFRYY